MLLAASNIKKNCIINYAINTFLTFKLDTF